MLKFGVVSATDPSTCRVRVRYQDNEGIESYWLAVIQRQSYGTRDYDMFVGLGVTQHSATEIDVAAGRLWDGVTGKRYAHDASETISLFSYLPVSDERYLNIAVIGQETDTDQEPRDYLTDLTSGTTEPKSVYMTTARQVAILITAGLESTGPQKPDAPTGYLTTAYVLLNPSGIVSIELASNKALMRLYDVYQTVLTQADWISAAAPKLSSLQTDIAALAAKLAKLATTSPLLLKVVADVAEIMWATLWLSECWRLAKPGAPVLVFSDWRQLPAMTDAVQAAGFEWRGIVVWHKPSARPMLGSFKRDAEFVIHAVKAPAKA